MSIIFKLLFQLELLSPTRHPYRHFHFFPMLAIIPILEYYPSTRVPYPHQGQSEQPPISHSSHTEPLTRQNLPLQ